jgi:hypothetical protein
MELHHHTHHPKKWKEYFWEFFMLFLAVFCGFLAEYQLEHKIEKDRVKKYMHDMVENLKYDIERVNLNAPINKSLRTDCDSLREEIKKAIAGQVNTNQIYYLFFKESSPGLVAFNRSAITQLKNSGQLRLVKSDSLLKKILDYYDRLVFASEFYREALGKESDNFSNISNDIFSYTSFSFLDSISDTTSPIGTHDLEKELPNLLNNKNLRLLKEDKNTLEKFYNVLSSYEASLVGYNRFLYLTRENATKLIKQINEEYGFTN